MLGELPELTADFSHVRELSLSADSSHLGGNAFLSSFSGVQYLTLSGLVLKSFPAEIYQMRGLLTLTLNDCAIGLTDATVEGLAHMEGLTLLDLSNNPLGLSPEVSYMKNLDSLYLANTGLATFPSGMFDLERLTFVDFTFNQVETLPDELFEVPDTRQVNYKFLNNPLNEASVLRVIEYDAASGLDRKILIQVDGVEEEPLEGWVTDESGIESGED
jgi:Leucine-rich repeat (LRR) protein